MQRAGPFLLQSVAGRGGMGVVWRAIHAQTGLLAAVKTHPADAPMDPVWRASFVREARAAANLDHPNVVRVLDLGDTEDGAAWIALEWAGAGTMAAISDPWGWVEVREALGAILDALAHAHARGVLHRDIKPANVLRGGLEHATWKLADFGLARLSDERDGALGGWGTPLYMAPEQARGREVDQGPWTDLYAVGCLAWFMVTGAPPFEGPPDRVRQAHQLSPLPPFAPQIDVPPEFEAWLRWLLAKDAEDRPAFAARARQGLDQIPHRDGARAVPFRAARGESPTAVPATGAIGGLTAYPGAFAALLDDADATVGAHTYRVADTLAAPASVDVPPATTPPAASPGPTVSPPACHARPELAARLVATPLERPEPRADSRLGPAILTIRPIPLVGRLAERARLHAALAEALEHGAPRLVALTGGAGVGKTRLAEWIAAHGHEAGVSVPLRVRGGEPLTTAFATHLGADVSSPAALSVRVARMGLLDEVDPIVTLLRGEAPPWVPAAERLARLAALLGALARIEPVVLILDDAADSPEATAFAALALALEAPVLVVATARDERLVGDAAARFQRLTTREDVSTRIELEPLDREDSTALVEALLGLDAALAARVTTRAEGNPQFAVQLVRSWGDRGWLVPGPHGFQLRDGVEPRLPDDLAALWSERAELALGPLGEDAHALEVAAFLGRDVDTDTWRDACAAAGCAPTPHGIERLYVARLATPRGPTSWSWAHAMLSAAVVRRAERAGRADRWRLACAAALTGRPAAEEAVGRLFLAAGHPERAIAPLLTAEEARRFAGDSGAALALLDDAARAADEAGLEPHDARRAKILGERAELLRFLGRGIDMTRVATEGRVYAREAHARAPHAGWDAAEARLTFQLGELARIEGRRAEARAFAAEAVAQQRALGDRARPGPALASFAMLLNHDGETDAAIAVAREAAVALAAQNTHAAVMGKLVLGLVLSGTAHDREARTVLEEALAEASRHGYAAHAGSAALNLAPIALVEGRLDDAEALYGRASSLFRRLGHPHARMATGMLAFSAALRGDAPRARAALNLSGGPPTRASADSGDIANLFGWVATSSLDGRRDATLAHLDQLCKCVALTGFGDHGEFPSHLGRLARRLALDGHPDAAERLARIVGHAVVDGAQIHVRPRIVPGVG